MAIEFLKADNNKQFVRPKGRGFPVGLSSASLTVDFLVIGGGGGGGGSGLAGAGGGAGGYQELTAQILSPGTDYSVTVGAGQPGGNSGGYNPGTTGSSSVFSSTTANGGGGSGSGNPTGNGLDGGSGGGAALWRRTAAGRDRRPAGRAQRR